MNVPSTQLHFSAFLFKDSAYPIYHLSFFFLMNAFMNLCAQMHSWCPCKLEENLEEELELQAVVIHCMDDGN